MRLLSEFARAYPARTAVTLACLLFAAIAEGVGVSGLLPLLGLATRDAGGPESTLEQAVIDVLAVFELSPTVGTLLALIAGGIAVKAALVLAANRQVGYTVAHVATDLRLGLIRALLRTRWAYFVHQQLGAFANAVAAEARRASEAYLHAATILALVIQSLVYGAVAFLVSWPAALAAATGGIGIVWILNRLVRAARRAGARQTQLSRSLVARLTDTLQSIKPLKAMGREGLVAPLLEHETEHLNRALQREVFSREALRALQEPLIVGFLAIGLFLALEVWSLSLASVLVLAILCARMVLSLGRTQKELQKMATCESAYWALRATLESARAEEETASGEGVPTLREEIRFDGVSFGYDDRWVLRDASIAIPAGKLTVLVGPSGAGKTTLVDLVIGLLEPGEGRILVDGTPLRSLDARRWRASIGYVPQETLLLHESVRTNVTLGDPDVDDAAVEEALRDAGAWNFVTRLPQGLDTVLGERGLRVSGGQRQRISLARALLRKPKLLVLDEATTALDPETELEIGEALQKLLGGITIVAICHHGALVRLADRVWRVAAGSVHEVSRGEEILDVSTTGPVAAKPAV